MNIIEILVSLIIVGIISISLIGVDTQAKINSKTQSNINAEMFIAQQESDNLQDVSYLPGVKTINGFSVSSSVSGDVIDIKVSSPSNGNQIEYYSFLENK